MLEVFHKQFYKWGYIDFCKLDYHIKGGLKEIFMAKKIYISKLDNYIN